MTAHTLVWLAFASSLLAQVSTVSPAIYTNRDGNFRNGWPWGEVAMRYQQIHSDVTGNGWLLRGLAFRADAYYGHRYGGVYSSSIYGVPRQTEFELMVGDSSFAGRSNVFANNYVGPPVTVLARRFVSLPDYRPGNPTTNPPPFDFPVPFDQPWLYTGANDLVWDVSVTNSSLGAYQFYPVDGFLNCTDCDAEYSYRNHGIGCPTPTSTGNLWMRLYDDSYTRQSTGNIEIYYHGFRAPANAAVAVNIGVVNPDLSVPFLCTRVYALPTITLLYASALDGRFDDASKRIFVPVAPHLEGAVLFAQALALDASQPPPFLGIAASQGVETHVPVRVAEHGIRRIYDNSAGAPFNPVGMGPFTSGLVVQFWH